ncbi:MAG: class I SAM-dependent methyltransferase, partial [Nitrospirota bacterium]|nr:class I SAM-dependent methyltransferase [Nitrospirota bacterium]
MMLPQNFYKELGSALNSIRNIEGYLTEREMKFLFLAGSCPTAEGEVLEIGSFKGKSTVILARGNILSGGDKIVAVDPLTSPSITDPDLKGKKSGLEEFQNNIQSAGIKEAVEFHQMFSYELSAAWQRDIRLLWIDGDHTYSGTKK